MVYPSPVLHLRARGRLAPLNASRCIVNTLHSPLWQMQCSVKAADGSTLPSKGRRVKYANWGGPRANLGAN